MGDDESHNKSIDAWVKIGHPIFEGEARSPTFAPSNSRILTFLAILESMKDSGF